MLNHQSQALVLPKEAILDDKGQKLIFIKKNDKFYPHLVQLGAAENSYVEILKGVNPGDEVVIKGNYQLKSKLCEAILKKAGVH